MRRAGELLAVLCVVAFLPMLYGCGSGGPVGGGGGPSGEQTIDLGTLQVGVASTAGFRTITLPSPDGSPLAFMAMYGAKITRLQESTPLSAVAILFASDRDGDFEIYRMNSDGSNVTQLTTNTTQDTQPAASPDGAKIAFSSKRDGDYEIFVMNADGTGQTQLTTNTKDDCNPVWSPDGTKIAFDSNRDGDYDIYKMKSTGASQANLTKNTGISDTEPDWSPDGDRLVFASDRNGTKNICMMKSDGTQQVSIRQNSDCLASPVWSPTEPRIAAIEYSYRNGYVYTYAGATSTDFGRPVVGDMASLAYSPDGEWIVLHATDGADASVWMADPHDYFYGEKLTLDTGQDVYPCFISASSPGRVLVGANGSDGGSNPPFGTQRPFAVVGIGKGGLKAGATVTVATANWNTVAAEALQDIGNDLVGVRVTATAITAVQEDAGRGLAARTWSISGTPAAGAVFILFAADDGTIQSIVAAADSALGVAGSQESVAQLQGRQLVLRGAFVGAYDAREPSRNRIADPAREVTLDSQTGEVLSVQ